MSGDARDERPPLTMLPPPARHVRRASHAYPESVFVPLSDMEEQACMDALRSSGVAHAAARLFAGWARFLEGADPHTDPPTERGHA